MVWRFLVAMASTSGTKEWSAHLKFYREKCDSRLSNRKYGFPKDCINNFFDFYHGWKLRIDSAISDKEAFFLWSYLTLVKIKHWNSSWCVRMSRIFSSGDLISIPSFFIVTGENSEWLLWWNYVNFYFFWYWKL